MKKFKIANQIISLDWNPHLMHPNLNDFMTEESGVDMEIKLLEDTITIEPSTAPLISTEYFKVYQHETTYQLFYPGSIWLSSSTYDTLTSQATIYLKIPLTQDICLQTSPLPSGIELNIIDYIFYAVRDLFFLFMQKKGIISVHSSSIVYKEKAYLFSASSGTGKTTHTNLWLSLYPDEVKILDGDVTAVTLEGSEPIAYGLPWCGSSNHFLNRRVPLGSIIFLVQSSRNYITPLSMYESILRISARCFTPTWSAELVQYNIDIAKIVAERIPCFLLECLPDRSAVELAKQHIDQL